ncbi:hypothetical protein DFQ04_2189 [Algoriphagus boseongensis]|uniref:Outer membrane protein with beta-barrel domain n=1 Tax=Algoriphagus boseongensis TaxID=1442587 RepID=A0A4R6T8E4_9BACT|nr:hypothetical protein [Algoriphagus boseongensis]TDQ17535.1 hypothetical protein DFQ04_2189 [Algoriphagus boseongensis]
MLRLFFSLSLALIASVGFAQVGLFSKNDLQIKISPLALFEPETIVIQGGIEYFWSGKVSTQSEIGINGGLFGMEAGRGSNENFAFFRSRNEIKVHLKKGYVAAELFYVQKNFERLNDGYFNGELGIGYERAAIDFKVIGHGLKIGWEKFVSKNIVIDRYLGVGFRHRNNQVEVLEGGTPGFPVESGSFTGDRYRYLGWSTVPNLTLGLKIGIMTK